MKSRTDLHPLLTSLGRRALMPGLAALLLSAAGGACSKMEQPFAPEEPAFQDLARANADVTVDGTGEQSRGVPADVPLPAAPPALTSRKLIRTANVAIEVDSFADAASGVRSLAGNQGGFVADNSSQRDDYDKQYGILVMRIPAERFDETLAMLHDLGSVERTAVSAQDVTKAYADLELRLAVKRQMAERLRRLLDRRAGTVGELLEIERELGRVVEEIERMEGERRYYDQQIALSTITVNLHEPPPVMQAGASRPLYDALGSSLATLSISAAAIVHVVMFLFPWLLLGGAIWRIVRRIRKRLQRPVT